MRRSLHSMLCASLLVALPLTTACAQQQKRDPNAFAWRGTVPAGRTVRIDDVNGSITVTRSTGADVSITAEKRWRRGDPADVRVQRVASASGDVTVCALWHEATCDPLKGIRNHRGFRWLSRNDVSVHFTVAVPDGVPVQLQSVNGSVSVRDIGSNVHAETVNGSITIHNVAGVIAAETVNGSIDAQTRSGVINAETVNGSIKAAMGAPSGAPLELSTVNGSVTLTLPDSVNAALDVSTVNGKITSDLPIMLRGEISRRRLRGTIGTGGSEIRVRTVNGGVTLRR